MSARDPLAAVWRDVWFCGLEVGGHGFGVAMTVEEQTPQVGPCLPVEGSSRRPGLVERADPAGPPDLPSPGSHDERVSIRNMVARLSAAYPSVDAVTVEATVRTAYDSFHRARVRAYVPILVERRSRRVLGAACRTAPGQATDGGGRERSHSPESGEERAVTVLSPETRRHPGPAKD
ncbi:three-helix bundle dimerization domain-containing protein [Streptomyces sp. NPDC005283]|uniref:three-helix bundle dimerization domain-containing protein n=1 Tax=Streptomyces sp. NPDC005283 TaxID=3156871 RepID=UPI0034558F26